MQRCSRLFVFLAGFSAALPASSANLFILGTNQPAALTAFPALHTLKAFEGRIYMGYGDWNLHPAVVVTSYQPDNGSFHLEFSANTDSIGIFREINGDLYVPSIDPVHFEDFHDLSYRSGGVWRDQSPIGMLHAFDVATDTGADLWIMGSKTVNDTANDNAVVFRSLNGGRTWSNRTIQSSQFRYYWGFSLRGKFYVSDTIYTNGIGTRVAPAPYTFLFKPTPIGSGNNQFIVGLAERETGVRLSAAQRLVTYDTTTWRTLRSNIYDFTCAGSNIFTLERNAVTAERALWMGSSVTHTQAVWQSLGFTNVPIDATCVEVMDEMVFVGDAQGRLWAGRLDGSEWTPPPPTVVNELNDEFGRGLAIDGDMLAVGAPDYSGSNYLCGQVTIWENVPTMDGGNKWTRTGVINPPEPSFSGWFGKDLALKGDLLVVAETGRDTTRSNRGGSSQVHLYQRTSQAWDFRQTMTHSNAHSVATDGELVVVGSSTQLYLYELSRDSNNLLSATAAGGVLFGPIPSAIYEPAVKVAVESNMIVAALSGDVSRYGGPGEVRMYERLPTGAVILTNVHQQGWTAPPRGAALKPDRFGFSVALKNGWLAVGAPRNDLAAMQSGSVHLYQRIIWTNGFPAFLLREVYSPSAQVEAAFGYSVALTESRLIVGSPGIEVNGRRHHGRGFIYELTQTNWVQIGEVRRPVNSEGEFGSKVAAGSDWVAVSSRFSAPSENAETRIALLPHLAPYEQWTSFHGLEGTNSFVSSDADGDRANNLVEYACNLDPHLADAVPVSATMVNKGLPLGRLTRIDGKPYLIVTHVRRRNYVSLGLNYSIETSEDLANWTRSTEPPSSVFLINAELELVTFRFLVEDNRRQLFSRVRVELVHQE